MKQITKFVAYNGTEFTDSDACLDYEARCQRADAVIARLSPKPKIDGCSFENGGGYIQHDPKVWHEVRIALLKLAQKECDHRWISESIDNPSVHPSWAGRILGEGCNKQLQDAWFRITCTDSKCREWGQPYYATHPEDAKQIAITP